MFSSLGKIGILIVTGLVSWSLLFLITGNQNPRELAGHKHAIIACVLIPDTDRIATMCCLYIRMCSRTGAAPLILTGHLDDLTDIDCNCDGTRLVSASKDGTVKLWDISSAIEVRSIPVCKRGAVLSVAFHPQGKIVATISSDGFLRIWDVETGAMKKQLKAHSQKLRCLRFNHGGDRIAVGSDNNGVAVWRWDNKVEPVLLFIEPTSSVQSIAFDATGRYLATGGSDNLIRIWNMGDQRVQTILFGHWEKINAIEFSPDGERLVSAASDRTIALWSVTEAREIKRMRKHPSQVMCLDCDFQKDIILSGGYGKTGGGGSVKVWKGFLGQ